MQDKNSRILFPVATCFNGSSSRIGFVFLRDPYRRKIYRQRLTSSVIQANLEIDK